jgi:hypothetical protein
MSILVISNGGVFLKVSGYSLIKVIYLTILNDEIIEDFIYKQSMSCANIIMNPFKKSYRSTLVNIKEIKDEKMITKLKLKGLV